MTVTVETIEGMIEETCWFQYDMLDDVLYLHLESHRDAPTTGETDKEGARLLRHAETGEPVGLSVFNWWRRFGDGPRPDGLSALCEQIVPWARRILPDS